MWRYRGTSLIRNCPPPLGHRRALGIVLLYGPRRRQVLMGEAPCSRCLRVQVAKINNTRFKQGMHSSLSHLLDTTGGNGFPSSLLLSSLGLSDKKIYEP